MISLNEKRKLCKEVIEISKKVGQKIMEVYNEEIDVTFKSDLSPVTKADHIAHNFILNHLKKLIPSTPIVSEEQEVTPVIKSSFWLVDPLDGTKEFIKRNGEFTVNISYIENSVPIIGVIGVPAQQMIYSGIVGDKAYKTLNCTQNIPLKIQSNLNDNEEVIIIGSRFHGDPLQMDKFLAKFSNKKFETVGSSLKFCKIAEGKAHIYPRFGRTMEWDTAAGQAVLMAAGGGVYSLKNTPLLYSKQRFENPDFFAFSSLSFYEKYKLNNPRL
jgi:3'(2'), 5'-bisphosphate nucleotidase